VEQVLRATPSATKAGDWGLVLAAASINYRIDEHEGAFVILVDDADITVASEALASFDAEAAPEPAPPAPDVGRSALGVLASLLFAGFFLLTGARATGSRWFDAGAASSEAILHGQAWRAVTALTLHADLLHLAGNVVASLVFITAVGRWLGAGLGALAILGCAAAANLLTAAVHRMDYVSVGASTATFAALGLVAGLQVARRLRHVGQRKNAWVPLGAGLGLFAMLGVGAGTDVFAHLFGLLVGAMVGFGAALAQLVRGLRTPGRFAQAALGAAAVAAVGLCWALALRTPL
jgi:membrane associated rhomboid family serine protease